MTTKAGVIPTLTMAAAEEKEQPPPNKPARTVDNSCSDSGSDSTSRNSITKSGDGANDGGALTGMTVVQYVFEFLDGLAYVSLDDLLALALSANSHAELVREHILLPGRWANEYHKLLSSMHTVINQNGLLSGVTVTDLTARRIKLVEAVKNIDGRFMTLPVKELKCVRDGRQLFVPNQRNPSRYIGKAGVGLTCCSQTSDEIPLGHDSDIAHLVGCVLPQVIFLI